MQPQFPFLERPRESNIIDELLNKCESYLSDYGLENSAGQVIDGTLVPVPKQRNSRATCIAKVFIPVN